MTKISKWQNSVVGRVQNTGIHSISDGYANWKHLSGGWLEIFNKSLGKDSHLLCQTCSASGRSTLHPFLPCPGPGRLTQWITSTGYALPPDLTPGQRQGRKEEWQGPWQKMGREGGWVFILLVPSLLGHLLPTTLCPCRFLLSFSSVVSLGIGPWLLCCHWPLPIPL